MARTVPAASPAAGPTPHAPRSLPARTSANRTRPSDVPNASVPSFAGEGANAAHAYPTVERDAGDCDRDCDCAGDAKSSEKNAFAAAAEGDEESYARDAGGERERGDAA